MKKKNPKLQIDRGLRQRLKKLYFILKISVIILSMLAAIYLYKAEVTSSILSNKYLAITKSMGFVVNHIHLNGQEKTPNNVLKKALNIKTHDPIFAFGMEDLRVKLENTDWIKMAQVNRILPDIINITILERTPIAIGQSNKKLYLIDDEGEIIEEKNLKLYKDLPIVVTDDSAAYVNDLYPIISKYSDLYKHIDSIIRVGERRWNIRFHNKTEVKLPEAHTARAWDAVHKLYKNNELLNTNIKILDLRIENKIYIEKF